VRKTPTLKDRHTKRDQQPQEVQHQTNFILMWNSTHWLDLGNFTLPSFYTGSGFQGTDHNFTITTTEPTILNNWNETANQDYRIKGAYLDFIDGISVDEIKFINVWALIDGKRWIVIGNHTEASWLSWTPTTAVPPQTNVGLRAKAIDVTGSNVYSNYFFKNNNMTIDDSVVPDPPTGLTATGVSETQINLSWTAPADDGGRPIIGYRIERESPVGGGFSILVANTSSTATTYSDTGLTVATEYNYRVSAISKVGVGNPSNEASAVTPYIRNVNDDPATVDDTISIKVFIRLIDGTMADSAAIADILNEKQILAPFDNGWLYRKAITILHEQVPEDLTDFPFLLNITNSDLRDFAQSDGDDIVFTNYTSDERYYRCRI